jgi:Glyoxalase-like domain
MPTRLVHLVVDAAEPTRLARFWAEALGWVSADIGQGDVPWTVLADPEGSEFCVLSPR